MRLILALTSIRIAIFNDAQLPVSLEIWQDGPQQVLHLRRPEMQARVEVVYTERT